MPNDFCASVYADQLNIIEEAQVDHVFSCASATWLARIAIHLAETELERHATAAEAFHLAGSLWRMVNDWGNLSIQAAENLAT
jgi:hypothetical protein